MQRYKFLSNGEVVQVVVDKSMTRALKQAKFEYEEVQEFRLGRHAGGMKRTDDGKWDVYMVEWTVN